MKLILENGYEFNMPHGKKYNIFYGPNKIGKTQISYGLKSYYEQNEENVLLFNDNILKDMIIQGTDDDNSFEVMPMIQEYNKYKKEYDNSKASLSLKDNLKKICSTNAKKVFTNFERVSEYIGEDVYSYNGEISKPNYTEDEIRNLFKSQTGFYNFFEIIEILIKDNIKVLTENIRSLVNYEVYSLQLNILENREKYEFCPVCYSKISIESIEKIKESIKNGSIEEKLKNSILYYLDSKYDKVKELINNLLMCNSYTEFKNDVIMDIENSIIFYLNELYDIKKIEVYLSSKLQIEKIVNEIKDFKISENQETYDYIKSKFKQHSAYKNSEIDIKINEGKLKIINSNIDYNKMSKSEQNFFKFLYFDILVHQKKQEGKLHIIVDDPFDSYDDIYVQDSIGIIVKLVNECIGNIASINIFSHSMYVVYLYENVSSHFNIYWLDQKKDNNEILVFSDNYDLLKKIEKNPCDYGLILKISEKLVDKYSLIAFAVLLRNEINVERLLMKNNNNSDTINFYQKVEILYNLISDSINHVKSEKKICDILSGINDIFCYELIDLDNETISDVMDDISSTVDNIDIKVKTSGDNVNLVNKKDVCYILIFKVLLGLKIRRIFEMKVCSIVKQPYEEIGELMKFLNNAPLNDFYDAYSYILNSFNHSSCKIVPPIFVYSIRTLQEIYDEILVI